MIYSGFYFPGKVLWVFLMSFGGDMRTLMGGNGLSFGVFGCVCCATLW